uniref:Uncharacterized protein LOC111105080 n=1 Tax=Crassostrea virginica TaxID=6565 RepID=A0A8B8AUF8_CRAVI|nr:uncharacterized protein LOC111105080 [Crassostrea virginica]
MHGVVPSKLTTNPNPNGERNDDVQDSAWRRTPGDPCRTITVRQGYIEVLHPYGCPSALAAIDGGETGSAGQCLSFLQQDYTPCVHQSVQNRNIFVTMGAKKSKPITTGNCRRPTPPTIRSSLSLLR